MSFTNVKNPSISSLALLSKEATIVALTVIVLDSPAAKVTGPVETFKASEPFQTGVSVKASALMFFRVISWLRVFCFSISVIPKDNVEGRETNFASIDLSI
ncbi:hypothetical protein D3C72_1964510 [compost metagenome]